MASSSAATDPGHLPPPSSPGISRSAPDPGGVDDVVAFRRFSRSEALRRRIHRGKRLMGALKDWYWALMEDVRVRYRDYYWKYGKSPVEDESGGCLGLGSGEGSSDFAKACVFPGCKSKAMSLTTYCSMHILSDPKQTLYKPCTYVVKRFGFMMLLLRFHVYASGVHPQGQLLVGSQFFVEPYLPSVILTSKRHRSIFHKH